MTLTTKKAEQDIAKLKSEIANLKNTILDLNNKISQLSKLIPQKDILYCGEKQCSKCGMKLDTVMGYVCSDLDCPTFLKARC